LSFSLKKLLLHPQFLKIKYKMSNKKEEGTIDVNESIDKAEHYVQENKKSLSIILGAIVLVVGGYLGYTQLIVKPQEADAQKQMFVAEQYFKNDSIDKAIKGDGSFPGFEEIIDKYGSSKQANLAHYYLGVSYLKKGEFEKAIEMLEKYDAEDDVTGAMALGCIGDANLELGKKDEALSYYRKAVSYDNNQFTAPVFMMKEAMVLELTGDWKGAGEVYEKIKRDYPNSTESREVGTYLARAQAMVNKG
jgi:TolA-binding protein